MKFLTLKKINIIYLFESYSKDYQNYIKHTIEALKKSERLNAEVLVFKGSSKESYVRKLPNFRIRKVLEKWHGIKDKNVNSLNYLESYSIRNNVDIIHLKDSYLFPKILNLLNKPTKKRPKIVITLRGGDTYVKPWHIKIWSDFYKYNANNIDAFVVMSKHQKDYLNTKWGVERKLIHVIPISYGARASHAAKTVSSEEIKIISAYRMCWEKNISGNLMVIKLLKSLGYKVKYDLFGAGPDRNQIYYLIDKYDISECVEYHGNVENGVLKDTMKNSDFCLQLSHSESLGMSVIEAQSLGLPAIISNSDGMPEIIIEEHSGFCVDPFDIHKAVDYILDLWKNPDLYISFSKAAIENAYSNFSLENEVERLHELYSKLVED